MKILKVVIEKGGMPEDCDVCEETWISNKENFNHCAFTGKDVSDFGCRRHPDCPLVEREVEDEPI